MRSGDFRKGGQAANMTVPLLLKVQGGNKPKKSISEGKIFPKGFLFPSSSSVHVLVQVGESISDALV